MALRIKLNFNAEMEVENDFYIRTPLGKTIHFKAGQKYRGQQDEPENGFWILHEGFVANIPPGNPIIVKQYAEQTA